MTLFIGITGASGSGKSSFSKQLSERLLSFGMSCSIVECDHYYHPSNHLSKEERNKLNFCQPDIIDFTLLESDLALLKNQQAIQLPCYNMETGAREKSTTTVIPADVVIVEGILIFSSQTIRDNCQIKIFVNQKLDLCLSRRLPRDRNERNLDYDFILKTYETLIRPSFFRHTLPSIKDSSLVLNSDNDINAALKKLPDWICLEYHAASTQHPVLRSTL